MEQCWSQRCWAEPLRTSNIALEGCCSMAASSSLRRPHVRAASALSAVAASHLSGGGPCKTWARAWTGLLNAHLHVETAVRASLQPAA